MKAASLIRLLKLLAFTLLIAGLVISQWGVSVEADSFRALDESEKGHLFTSRSEERAAAYRMKDLGFALAIAGPAVWLVGWLVLRKRK